MRRIVSGGQTGVDRAALDAALACGVECGGWCPRGRRAEDGRIPDRYPLFETESRSYAARTRRNVEESDGTLVLARGPLAGGTRLTAACAGRRGRPCLVVDLAGDGGVAGVRDAAGWLAAENIAVLNVAGPREGTAPGIGAAARRFMDALLAEAATPRSRS